MAQFWLPELATGWATNAQGQSVSVTLRLEPRGIHADVAYHEPGRFTPSTQSWFCFEYHDPNAERFNLELAKEFTQKLVLHKSPPLTWKDEPKNANLLLLAQVGMPLVISFDWSRVLEWHPNLDELASIERFKEQFTKAIKETLYLPNEILLKQQDGADLTVSPSYMTEELHYIFHRWENATGWLVQKNDR